ncbi:unnamed protein product [Ceutorhynchus assimilis]|uniref:Uncharacterized protein n=1 Tax=Ceutorhynchus assimilis TaxID=467358 RepID=A0A9N9MHX8_9CUCU|nr:unnamed protein product [Ceutorhynchus assimilis]
MSSRPKKILELAKLAHSSKNNTEENDYSLQEISEIELSGNIFLNEALSPEDISNIIREVENVFDNDNASDNPDNSINSAENLNHNEPYHPGIGNNETIHEVNEIGTRQLDEALSSEDIITIINEAEIVFDINENPSDCYNNSAVLSDITNVVSWQKENQTHDKQSHLTFLDTSLHHQDWNHQPCYRQTSSKQSLSLNEPTTDISEDISIDNPSPDLWFLQVKPTKKSDTSRKMNIIRDIAIPRTSGLNSLSSINERATDVESIFEPSEESSRQDHTGSQKWKTLRDEAKAIKDAMKDKRNKTEEKDETKENRNGANKIKDAIKDNKNVPGGENKERKIKAKPKFPLASTQRKIMETKPKKKTKSRKIETK